MSIDKFLEIISHEGVVSIVTWANNEAHIVNTWNSHLDVTEDGRVLIPAAGMNTIEADTKENNKVKITVGSKEVQGTYGMGAGCRIEGTAKFLTAGEDFEMMKGKFPFLTRVIEINVEQSVQTL
jgi:hypothetical protein